MMDAMRSMGLLDLDSMLGRVLCVRGEEICLSLMLGLEVNLFGLTYVGELDYSSMWLLKIK